MTRSRLAVVLVAAAAILWWIAGKPGAGGSHPSAQTPTAAQNQGRSIDPAFQQQLGQLGKLGRNRTGAVDWNRSAPQTADGVTITGKVLDQDDHKGVGDVEVVFRDVQGENSTRTAADGTYRIAVAPGTYRAFVRDDSALSVGVEDLVRLPGVPTSDAANAVDDALLPMVVAVTDVDHVDLSVVFGGTVAGTVVDRSGHAVVGAVLRARGSELRPALGTDVAESDEHGRFDMRLPPGQYVIEATHAQLVGVTGDAQVVLTRGDTVHPRVTLTAGCVIAGHVITASGQPAGDGAIERRFGPGDDDFGPSGRIANDGTFRWVTGETASVALRAWPWKSPPALAQTFECKDGARFENVVFRIPNQAPDIAGTLVDAAGEPVAMGFIDVSPVDGGFGQQERSDATGHWAVYHMPAGQYRITASTPTRGVVAMEVAAPKTDVRLALGGTGRIEGTVPALAEGSFELSLQMCDAQVGLSHAPRLVAVHDGKFAIDDVPACELHAVTTWQGEEDEIDVTVPPNGVATTELALGPPQLKTIHGVVRDESGRPVPGAIVLAFGRGSRSAQTDVDAQGKYSIQTIGGADLIATEADGKEPRQGYMKVSRSNAPDEEIDIVMHAGPADDEGEGDDGSDGGSDDVKIIE